MRHTIIHTLFTLLILTFSVYSHAQSAPKGNEKVASLNPEFEQEVVRLTNIERKKKGLSILKQDSTLVDAARYHAKSMAENNYLEHASYSLDKSGKLICVCPSSSERIRLFLQQKAYCVAENIAAGQTTPEETVESWMKSSGHRKNILNPEITHIGVGYYSGEIYNSEYPHYWVQNFRCALL